MGELEALLRERIPPSALVILAFLVAALFVICVLYGFIRWCLNTVEADRARGASYGGAEVVSESILENGSVILHCGEQGLIEVVLTPREYEDWSRTKT